MLVRGVLASLRRMLRALAIGVLSASTAMGCGSVPPREEPPAVSSAGGVPATDRDPLPYTPEPSTDARAGTTVSLAAAGGEDQARRMLPELLIAVRDGDERQLENLFAEEVVMLDDRRRGGPRLRAEQVQRILVYARRSILAADADPEDLVDLSQVAVRRAAEFFDGEEMPERLRPTDLVVEVPVQDEARGALRTVLGWHLRGHLIVRPGRDPRIVAM